MTETRVRSLQCVAVLAVGTIAMVSCGKEVDDYKRKTMAAEAHVGLNMMQRAVCEGLAEGAIGERPRVIGPVPKPGSCCETAKKMCRKNEEEFAPFEAWSWWQQDERFRYSYELRFADDDRSFTVSAYGDLDCDGKLSTYQLMTPIDDSGRCGMPKNSETDPLE